jgi:hypothetical protein
MPCIDDAREPYKEEFKKIVQRAKELGVDVETDIAVGHPVERIVHRAEMDPVDLIVLGRRGKSRFEKMLVGSTADQRRSSATGSARQEPIASEGFLLLRARLGHNAVRARNCKLTMSFGVLTIRVFSDNNGRSQLQHSESFDRHSIPRG